jgi:hypothetical protein
MHQRKFDGKSVKKFPGYKDGEGGHNYGKNYANRKVRHSVVGNFGNYKKVYEKYDICDYNFRYYSRRELLEHCEEYYGDKWSKKHYNPDKVIREYWRAISK